MFGFNSELLKAEHAAKIRSLRDHFAGIALKELMAAGGENQTPEYLGKRAYEIADAMLRTREDGVEF